MTEQTSFQKEFKVNDEFYSGQQIRDAIRKHLMKKNTLIKDAQLTHRGDCLGYGNFSIRGLENHVLDIDVDKDLFPTNYCSFTMYENLDGEKEVECCRMTEFEATDLGYICLSQK